MKDLICVVFLILVGSAVVCAQQSGPTFYNGLAWSPDGKYLAMTGMRDVDQKTNTFKASVYVLTVKGAVVRKVTDDSTKDFFSTWSKDSGRLFFIERSDAKSSALLSLKIDGSDRREVAKDLNTPAMSPDGKKIAFISTRDAAKNQIYVMKADGSEVRRLTTDAGVGYFNPEWSPDGKIIVYYAEKGDRHDQVWKMNADGSNQILLTGNIGHNIYPAWAPDGKHIIFASNRGGDDKANYIDGSALFVMSADGSNLTPLGNIKSFFARYSPDGKKIAFILGKFPESDIFIADADGSNPVKLTVQ